jgi:hypothetical protein
MAYTRWAAIFLGDICLPQSFDSPEQAASLRQGFITSKISLKFYWFEKPYFQL